MKKTIFFSIFFAIAFFSFAQEMVLPNRTLFIDGTAEVSSHRTYFMDNFKMEAGALGFNVVDNKADAGYTFKFDSQRYDGDFIVLITLTLNEGDMEIVNFGWPYSNLDEMYEYNQFVFFKAAVLIPGINEDELRTMMAQERVDPRWRNKWVYLRVTFDYPIAFHIIDKERNPELIAGSSVYNGSFDNPTYVQFIDHKVLPMPGATVGIEIQPLNFLRLEVNFQVHLGNTEPDLLDNLYMSVSGAVKVPLKIFKNFDIVPYAAYLLPLKFMQKTFDRDYEKYPDHFVGFGAEVNVKMGKSGALVFDFNYMFPLPFLADTDTVWKNPYEYAPNPEVIHFNRFDIGIKVGYKFGFINRRIKTKK